MRKCLWLLLFVICPLAQASQVKLGWDANTEPDLAGYYLYRSTTSLLDVSTQAARGNRLVKISTMTKVVETLPSLTAETTVFFRLTAYDTNKNESGFNVDDVGGESEVAAWVRRGDVNADGLVDVIDLSMLVADWNKNMPRSDFNSSGKVDIVDLSMLVFNWGKE